METNEDHSHEEKVVSQAQASMTMKDFMTPFAIVIAGAFVGIGLYYSGGETSGTAVANVPTANTGEATEKVNPITDSDHIRGAADAPVKIVEYSDFDCPFCSRFHDTMNAIVEASNGEVAWVFRQFPLEQLHPQAPAVALASECVAEIGGNDAFWTFADGYFASRGAREQIAHTDLIPRLVTEAGVSQQQFTVCFDEERHKDAIQEDMDDAVETGGRGTPWSVLIGPTGKTYPLSGAQPQATIERMIELAKEEA